MFSTGVFPIKSPEAPDPYETANAQAGMNRDTAITQQQLNMVNQVTPYGNLTYTQSGSAFNPSKTGQTYYFNPKTGEYASSVPGATSGGTKQVFDGYNDRGIAQYKTQTTQGSTPSGWQTVKGNLTPQYTATQTLSPEMQAIFDKTTAANTNLAGIAEERSKFLQDYLKQDFSVDQAVEDKLYNLGASRLDPRFAQERSSMEEDLINRGIRPGSQAYSQLANDFGQTKNDAYNQLALTGRQQAFNEASYERALPLNEITALLSGAQVQQPNYVNTPQTQVGGVDYTGLVNQKYQGELANYQSGMGGLFGLAGTLGLGAMKYSDERLKENIERVGETDGGQPLYKYNYKGQDQTEIGVMAQETDDSARAVDPITGFLMVDYSKVH